jgi:rhodanese-related sulfurtransferase
MNNILPFIIHHWPLLASLAILIILLIIEETKTSIKGVTKIPTSKVVELMNHKNAVVIDIRESTKFKAGHIIGAINITIDEIANSIDKLTKYKDLPIILVCYVGQASIKAGAILKKNNFAHVFSLAGGIAEWQKAGLPLIKP